MRMMKSSLFIAPVFALALTINAQERVRTIADQASVKNAPIAIVTRELGTTALSGRNQIIADSDWLKNLRLNIKNVSNKNISHVEITLLIWKQAKMPAAIAFTIEFGHRIHIRNGVPVEMPKGKVLAPNESIRVGITERDYEFWTKKLKEFEAENFDRVILDIRQVRFEDGTIWHLGQGPWRQDSN